MSEFQVRVVRIGAVEKHPNADALSKTMVDGGYPVLFRTGEFREGDLAVYLPINSVVPAGDPRWAFLGEHRRIRAKRLRGVFSMGLLAALPPLTPSGAQTGGLAAWSAGDDAAAALGITKYEPPEPLSMGGEDESDPGLMPVYDIDGLRKYGALLLPGEEVWITEKIHGANGRWVHDGVRLLAGSRTAIKRESATNLWWLVARKYDLEQRLSRAPGIAFYGEVFGHVQDLNYGVPKREAARLVVFDALDTRTRRWLEVDEFLEVAGKLELPVVPTLFRGPWSPALGALAEGKSMMPGADHVREGIVVKPVLERFHPEIGRVFLKLHGEGFLTRKSA